MVIAYPWFLLLLLPLVALFILAWKHPLPSLKTSFLAPFQKASGKRKKLTASSIPLIVYAVATAFLIVALARPRQGLEEIKQRAEGIDIMLAVDLSGSMEAIDVPGNIGSENELKKAIRSGTVKNRLEVAKQEIQRFISKRPNDRIGLIGFAQLPYNACPPTLDHAWLIKNLKRLHPGIIGDATGIAGPVASAVHRLKNADSKRRVLVVFTDGSNNVEAKISPRQAARLADKFDVTIYTVGIGSSRAYVLRNTFFGEQFVPLEGQFDEKLLKDMAELANGKYYRAADSKGLEKVMNEINKMEKTTVTQPKTVNYRELAPWLITASGILILLAFLLENTLMSRLP
jgi:Ca-activated chloride channel family protein